MAQIYTVVRQTMLAAGAEQAWRYLVDGTLLTKWFADAGDLRPDAPFRFAFGDGDFFSGLVTEWHPPVSLGLEWRFLDVGPSFNIRFSLLPVGEQTELTVQDRGAATVEEAIGLRDGWEDFVMRCEKLVRTGENSRYRWTEVFGGTAFAENVPGILSCLAQPGVWRHYFNDSQIAVETNHEGLTFRFQDPAWNGVPTQGELKMTTNRGHSCLHVVHRGWETLAPEIQVAERSRYAANWAALLKQVECGGSLTA